ncbi:MAG: hypothetical protein JSS16_15230 [Proteobacteria bacterium]|uniref:hypothetical protein n=1 Tax=Rudaea sp. TaxID=2136325 RepID=UPI001D1E5C8A|nr:hypothetical protein [Pseudomonadota bacterium]MBS0567082.1 hypothetical protein [Pseudomonadota bacterium]
MPIQSPPPDTDPATLPADARLAPTPAVARQSSTAQISSIVALAVSVLALATGAYQTRLMQAQARASVWPIVSLGLSYFGSRDKGGFTWEVENNGVGPALIKSVTLSLDGKPMRNWDEVYQALFGRGRENATVSSVNGNVLPPSTNRDTTIAAIRTSQPDEAKALFEAKDRFKMTVCYCSVYDECWEAQWLKREVKPVAQCTVANTVQFEQ